MDNETLNFIFAASNFTDNRSVLLKMSTQAKILFCFATFLSLSIGWVSKCMIYLHIFRRNIRDQPINILIFIDQLIHHFCGNLALVNFSASQMTGLSGKELVESLFGNIINGTTYCFIFGHVQVFGTIFVVNSGLGIALIRLLYLKGGTWLKYKFGELRFIQRVVVANFLLTGCMTILYKWENISNRSVYNICKGYNQDFQVKISFLLENKKFFLFIN